MDRDALIKQKIIDYLASHIKMTLATVTPEGKPLAHTVVYANDGATVYFRTANVFRKYTNIMNNPAVAYAVDDWCGDDWYQLRAVQMEGIATVLTEQADIDKFNEVYFPKFHYVDNIIPRDYLGFVLVKVEPVEGRFLDYAEGLAQWDIVKF